MGLKEYYDKIDDPFKVAHLTYDTDREISVDNITVTAQASLILESGILGEFIEVHDLGALPMRVNLFGSVCGLKTRVEGMINACRSSGRAPSKLTEIYASLNNFPNDYHIELSFSINRALFGNLRPGLDFVLSKYAEFDKSWI